MNRDQIASKNRAKDALYLYRKETCFELSINKKKHHCHYFWIPLSKKYHNIDDICRHYIEAILRAK